MREGLADTSVIIAWDDPVVVAALPDVAAISTITLAEFAAGPHLAHDPSKRADPRRACGKSRPSLIP